MNDRAFYALVLPLTLQFLCTAFSPPQPHLHLPSHDRLVLSASASALSAYKEYQFQLEFDAVGVGKDLPTRLTAEQEENQIRSIEERFRRQFNRTTFVLDRDGDIYMEQWFNVNVKGGFYVKIKRGGILVVERLEESPDDLVLTVTPKHTGFFHSFSVSCTDPTCRITGAQSHAKGLQLAEPWTLDGSQSIAWTKTPSAQEGEDNGMPVYMQRPALEWRLLAGKRRFLFWTAPRRRHYYDFEVTLNNGDETPADALLVAMEDAGYFCGWKDGSTLTVEGDPDETVAILLHARHNFTLTGIEVKCCFPDSGRCAGWQTGPLAMDHHKVYNRSSDTLVYTSSFENKQVKQSDLVLVWNTRIESQSIKEGLKEGRYTGLDVVD